MQGQLQSLPTHIRSRRSVLAGFVLLVASSSSAHAQTNVFASTTELELPVAQGAQEPSLYAMDDGRVFMNWTEPHGEGFAVRTSIGDSTGWTKPQTAILSADLFVNWADFPSVAGFPDGTLAMHWLMENGQTNYDYDVNIALSSDGGRSWGDVIVPHRDGTQSQHGFATLLPTAQDQLTAIWLDGRNYDTGTAEDAFTDAMQLRATTIGSDGSLSEDTLLDARTCTCCQTSAAVTDSGVVLVAYRDRTAEEIRDISVVRLVDGIWTEPATVHNDGWEIDGCPVNGPAIDTEGERAVVAWFTAALDNPVVKVAFSDDAGRSFGRTLRIDNGEAAGRVDVLLLGDGTALISWVEWTKAGEALIVCRALPEIGCSNRQVITLNDTPGVINFPSMVLAKDGVYIAWTQPLNKRSANPDLDVTIRMVFASF
jgi:hypothetical protein